MSEAVRIGDVAEIFDGPHATPPPCNEVGPFFLGIPQITPSGHIDVSDPRYIAESDYAKWTKRVTPRHGDVVFSYEATLNLYAIIPANFKCCLGRRMGLVRPNPDRLDYQYLYYYFFSKRWRDLVREKTISGATVERLPIATFPDFTIVIPPLEEQRKIAAILSDYDAAIANCRKQIALLEEAAQRLYREWFGDEKGEKKKFSDIASVCSGKRPPKRSDMMTGECSVPLFGASEQMGYTSEALYSEPILITGRVGTHGIVQRVVSPCWPSDNTLVVKSQYFAFAYQFMKQIDYGSMNRGVAQPLLTQSDLKDVAMFMPSEGMLLKYEEDAGVMLKSVDVLSQQIRSLTEARDRLLPKLMSGEVAV